MADIQLSVPSRNLTLGFCFQESGQTLGRPLGAVHRTRHFFTESPLWLSIFGTFLVYGEASQQRSGPDQVHPASCTDGEDCA